MDSISLCFHFCWIHGFRLFFDFFSEEEIIINYRVAFDTKCIFVIGKIASAVWALFHDLSGYVFNIYPASMGGGLIINGISWII